MADKNNETLKDDKLDELNNMLDDISSLDDINSPEAVQNTSLDDISSSETNNSENKDEDSPDDLNKTLEFPEDDLDTVEIKKEIIDKSKDDNILITDEATIKDETLKEKNKIIDEIVNETVNISYNLKNEDELDITDTLDKEDTLLKRLKEAVDTNLLEEQTNDIEMNHTVEKAYVAMHIDDSFDSNGEMSTLITKTLDDELLLSKDPLEQTILANNLENEDAEDEPPIKKKCDEDIRRSVDDILNNDSSSSLIESTDVLNSVDSIRKSIEEEDLDETLLEKTFDESLTEEIDLSESLPEKTIDEDLDETVLEKTVDEFVAEEESIQEENKDKVVEDAEKTINEESEKKSVDGEITAELNSLEETTKAIVADEDSSDKTEQAPLEDDDDVCIVEKGNFIFIFF